MQISDGSADVTNGSATVVASPNTDWSDAQVALQQGSPVYFSLIGATEIPVQVIAATQPAISASGNWELTLVEPWIGATLLAQPYMIHKDFTPNAGLAIPSAGDTQWAQMYARNATIIDYFMGQGAFFTSSPVTGQTTVVVPAGKTLYISDELDIPAGVEIDVLAGGAVEIG